LEKEHHKSLSHVWFMMVKRVEHAGGELCAHSALMTAAVALGFLGMNPALYAVILLAGTLEGAAAGYLASATWNRYLSKHLGASR